MCVCEKERECVSVCVCIIEKLFSKSNKLLAAAVI